MIYPAAISNRDAAYRRMSLFFYVAILSDVLITTRRERNEGCGIRQAVETSKQIRWSMIELLILLYK